MTTNEEVADGLLIGMLRLCLCGICENARNGDEVYYFGGSCEGELGCCLGGHRVTASNCNVRALTKIFLKERSKEI